MKKRIVSVIRGWFPKEPLLKGHLVVDRVKPEVKAELEQELSKKLIKAIAMTNPIIGGIIFAANNGITVLVSAEVILALLTTNVLIYQYFKHRIFGGRV